MEPLPFAKKRFRAPGEDGYILCTHAQSTPPSMHSNLRKFLGARQKMLALKCERGFATLNGEEPSS